MPLRRQVLSAVRPVVGYGLHELPLTSPAHAMYEVAAISYLMGMGYSYADAHRVVESWEVGEAFPPYQGTVHYHHHMIHSI
ncbi:hypothetical protein MJA45_17540 [Paenibacillus aurantius]|uniref:Uncharacterized protein n=1 Tax=Paenibacillus aurantius TaxID=2918900 RepID=A0AA96L9D4_9BACL|nr:hypothetical protein [Paenibacillus aurantius]WNQ09427.1 hypothetical protein MJA45_17540 [Paenibacillus aurantius]